MMWYDAIIAAHTAVTDCVSHGGRMKSDRYFVWQEDGGSALLADGTHGEKRVTGFTDLFTQTEFDPWAPLFEASLDATPGISWELDSIQYEEDTGFWHYLWEWSIPWQL